MGNSMNPDDFYELFVLSNYEDFENNKESIRHAFNASLSLSHMADHYFEYNKKHNKSKVEQFIKGGEYYEVINKNRKKKLKDISVFKIYISEQTNDDYNSIRSISNAYKHLYTAKDTYSDVTSAGSVMTISFPAVKRGDVSELDVTETVVFTRKNNSQREEVLPLLKRVKDFWKGFL
ncbi:MAG TPA: hypothetical protein ENH82_20455 [bacterium]|nr:hypothetical protein [bacterium]